MKNRMLLFVFFILSSCEHETIHQEKVYREEPKKEEIKQEEIELEEPIKKESKPSMEELTLTYSGKLKEDEFFKIVIDGRHDVYKERKSVRLLMDRCQSQKECFKLEKGNSFLEFCFDGKIQEVCPMYGDIYPDTHPTGRVLHGQRCHLAWSPCEGLKKERQALKDIHYQNINHNRHAVISSKKIIRGDKSVYEKINSCSSEKKQCFGFTSSHYSIEICIKGILEKVCRLEQEYDFTTSRYCYLYWKSCD